MEDPKIQRNSSDEKSRIEVASRFDRTRRISDCSDTSEDNRPQFFIGSYDEKEKSIIKESRRGRGRTSLTKVKEKSPPAQNSKIVPATPQNNVIKNETKSASGEVNSPKGHDHCSGHHDCTETELEDPSVRTPQVEHMDGDKIPKDISSQTLKQEDHEYSRDNNDQSLDDITPIQQGVCDKSLAMTDSEVTLSARENMHETISSNRTETQETRTALTDNFVENINSNTNNIVPENSDCADLNLSNGNIPRPDSLSLPKPLQFYERQKKESAPGETLMSPTSASSDTDRLLEAVICTPLHDQGTLTREGDMIEFVAEDLTEKIRMSSPLSKSSADTPTSGSRISDTSSSYSIRSLASQSSSTTSGWTNMSNSGMSRSPSVLTQSPEDIPPIDPRVILDLEQEAQVVAVSLDAMMSNLKVTLHKMSGMTSGCLGAYQQAIDSTCDTVDASIKSMYALMAKCEELTKSMQPVYHIAEQIKEMKRLLDLFESQVAKDVKEDS